jgi:ribokinase
MRPTDKLKLSSDKPLVVGIGLCALDYICIVENFPGKDEKHVALAGSIQGGGPVPTALCALSRLGGKAAFIGKCGTDHEGESIRQELDQFGVDTSRMVFDKSSVTPKAFIWVDSKDGARTVVLDRTKTADLLTEELDTELLQSCRYLLIDGRESQSTIAAAKIAKEASAEVILDAGSIRENMDELLSLVDHLVVSRTFSDKFTGQTNPEDAIKTLAERNFKSVIITLGAQGAIWAGNGKIGRQPAFKMEVADTTGAGDVFHGAYIYGLCQNWETPAIVKFACAAAALKCRKPGGRLGIPTLAEVEKFLGKAEVNT